MFRCSRCNQSRWVHVRFGTLANDLERLTGWVPYWCQACERRGWHHSRSTRSAFELRRQFRRLSPARLTLARSAAHFLARFPPAWLSLARLSPSRIALKNSRKRVPTAVLKRWLLATAGVLVFTFVLGLWMGTVLFPDLTVSAKLENLTAAADVAPARTTPDVPDKPSVEPEPARVTRPPTTPSGGDSPPAVTAAAATPTGKSQRLPPSTATKPVVRAPTPRHRPQPRAASRPKPVPRAAAADAPKAAVRAVTASPAPALPRFHGSLAIHSEPRGALVWVDGQIVGPTPVLLKGVRAGSRVVRIESDGYERWSSAARVVADQNTAIVATLQRH